MAGGGLCHPSDELERVAGPFVVQEREDGHGHLLDVLGLAAPAGMDEALLKGRFSTHLVRSSL